MRRFKLFTLVHGVRLFWWYFSLHLYYGKLLSEGRNSLCSEHFQGPRVFVTCCRGGNHAQIHSTEQFSFFITHSASAGSKVAGANSRALTTGQALNWNPWRVTSCFITTLLCILINPLRKMRNSRSREVTPHIQTSEAIESENRAQRTVSLTTPEAYFEIVLRSEVWNREKYFKEGRE